MLIAVEYDNRVTVVDNAADTIEVFWRFGDEYTDFVSSGDALREVERAL